MGLACIRCGHEHEPGPEVLRCRHCAAPLEVAYRDQTPTVRPPRLAGRPPPLPLHHQAELVTLGEGATPCVPLPRVASELGLRAVWAKLETTNPTGSFKDRGTAIMASALREHGVREVVEDSSGNAGASLAAYAARAGIVAHIFAPASAPEAKVAQIRVFGAAVHLIEGPRDAATAAAEEFCKQGGLVYASHNLSPYFIEGTKLFAYELVNPFIEGLPRHIVVPVGNGSLFIGLWKGLRELAEAGLVDTPLPRLHCVQTEAVRPAVAAFLGQRWDPGEATPTVAGGIAVARPPRLTQVLRVLQESSGRALAVAEADILRWQGKLARLEGIYVEPTSAAALAGLERLLRDGVIAHDDDALVPLTGSGLKDRPPPLAEA